MTDPRTTRANRDVAVQATYIIYTHTHTRVCVCIYTYVYIYIYIHTHIYTYIYIYMSPGDGLSVEEAITLYVYKIAGIGVFR